jgi:hypothetical protein
MLSQDFDIGEIAEAEYSLAGASWSVMGQMGKSTAWRCPACITQKPTFASRKRVLSREYYVRAKWPDGHSVRIGSFSEKLDAERWIKTLAADWLAHREV